MNDLRQDLYLASTSPSKALSKTFGSIPHRWLIFLAVVYTLLNCLKPIQVDDAAYYYYAKQIAQRPLDPYGFAMFWEEVPQPANEVLAPPVFLYWWAALLRLDSTQPAVWKLGLLPWVFLFVYSLYFLFRRFARGLELPLVSMTVLSPAILPSLNLMLDIPALTLSLTALVIFCRSTDRGADYAGAALAGIIAGLAMETKYTGFLALASMFLYAWMFGSLRLWIVAAVATASVFVAWEFLIGLIYGESHFLLHLRDSGASNWPKPLLLFPLITILGSVASIGVLLGLAALRMDRRWILLAGCCILAVYLGMTCWHYNFNKKWIFPEPLTRFGPLRLQGSLEQILFGVLGLGLSLCLGIVVWQLGRLPFRHVGFSRLKRIWAVLGRPFQNLERSAARDHDTRVYSPRYATAWFLVLWLLLEVAGYFALTPFPAVRRVLGIVVVSTLLMGRLASRTCRNRRGLIKLLAGVNIVLGLIFFGVDWRDAHVQKQAVELATSLIRQEDPQGAIWYIGHWGFQYYAEQAGMQPVVPRYHPSNNSIPLPPPSVLRAGDWLVLPDRRIPRQPITVLASCTKHIGFFQVGDRFFIPWRTVMCFYGGRTGVEHQTGPRLTVEVRRVTADHICEHK